MWLKKKKTKRNTRKYRGTPIYLRDINLTAPTKVFKKYAQPFATDFVAQLTKQQNYSQMVERIF